MCAVPNTNSKKSSTLRPKLFSLRKETSCPLLLSHFRLELTSYSLFSFQLATLLSVNGNGPLRAPTISDAFLRVRLPSRFLSLSLRRPFFQLVPQPTAGRFDNSYIEIFPRRAVCLDWAVRADMCRHILRIIRNAEQGPAWRVAAARLLARFPRIGRPGKYVSGTVCLT